MSFSRWMWAFLVAGWIGVSPALAAEPGVDFFEKKIRPVLVQHCYQCHSAQSKEVKGGLLVDTREAIRKGGESGAAVIPKNGKDSLILEALRHEGLEMPPKEQLSEAIIADFEKWIEMGAPDPRDGAAVTVKREINIEEGRKYWAFQPPKSQPAPQVKDTRWARGDLDRFVLARLEQEGLRPVADADRRTLIRRVTFDLTGLPPTPADVEAFVADQSPGAFEKVVDRLLASPQFGERWGRHWLDIARYGESTGKERNVAFRFAWRYRDYVIDALNSDKPYDQFIVEQVAGDLLPSQTPAQQNERLVATGFLALGPKGINDKNAQQYLMDVVDEQIDVTCRAVLGVTVGCARCHDHKFDPIPTQDYYALAGIFKSTEVFAGVVRGSRAPNDKALLSLASTDPNLSPEAAAEIASLTKEYIRYKSAEDGKNKKPAKPAKNKGDDKADEASNPKQRMAQIEARLKELGASPDAALAMGVRDGSQPADCQVCIRGEPDDLGPSVPRGYVQVIAVPSAPKPDLKHSGRLEFAQWLVSRDNPLTARVMANRAWQHLFGEGLVATTDNFGALGEQPTHPQLLDWLAIRLMDQGWSVKSLLKTILLSRAYQMSSDHDAASYERDPQNKLVWRMSRRRLDAEAIRDAILATSGQLEPGRPEASPVRDLKAGEIGRGLDLGALSSVERRRGIYQPIVRGVLPEILATFDAADPSLVVGQREVTTVPTQALFLMNSPFVIEQSEHLAASLLAEAKLSDSERIDQAYRRLLGRPATKAELERSLAFVQDFAKALAGEPPAKPAANNKAAAAERDKKARRREMLEALAAGAKDNKPVAVNESSLAAWTSLCQAIYATAEFRYLY